MGKGGPLFAAIVRGQTPVVELLCAYGVSSNVEIDVSCCAVLSILYLCVVCVRVCLPALKCSLFFLRKQDASQ